MGEAVWLRQRDWHMNKYRKTDHMMYFSIMLGLGWCFLKDEARQIEEGKINGSLVFEMK
jgi:hypothetical protein